MFHIIQEGFTPYAPQLYFISQMTQQGGERAKQEHLEGCVADFVATVMKL